MVRVLTGRAGARGHGRLGGRLVDMFSVFRACGGDGGRAVALPGCLESLCTIGGEDNVCGERLRCRHICGDVANRGELLDGVVGDERRLGEIRVTFVDLDDLVEGGGTTTAGCGVWRVWNEDCGNRNE